MLPEQRSIYGDLHCQPYQSKCDKFKEELQDKNGYQDHHAQVDANDVDQLIALIEQEKPDIVINVALPYQDLTIMDACLATKTDYVDTANYEPEDTAKFEYKWQWAYRERFEKAGITALLGSGFDPGVTGVFCAYAQKHYFDEIHYIDILDCNGGDHGYPFATNFNPEINIREVSAKGSYIENGEWVETELWKSSGSITSTRSAKRICICCTTKNWNLWR